MVHPTDRRRDPALTGADVPVIGQPDPEDDKFDKELPHDGWSLALGKNTFLAEIVGQLPRSGSIITVEKTNARNDKEWHLIVHDIAPKLEEHFESMGLKRGERVVISGSATAVFFNGMEFCIVPFNAIQAILRRQDGELFIGSKYGAKAVEEGKPASASGE